MRCQSSRSDPGAASAAILSSPSCTRFSPKSRWPASAAARTRSAPNVFDTATSWISEGERCARSAATVMRRRTDARCAAISAATGLPGIAGRLFDLREQSLGDVGVLTGRRQLEVLLEGLLGFGHLAEVHVRHAE